MKTATYVRWALITTVVVAAGLWGVAVGLLAGPVLGALAAAFVLWRGRHAWSTERIALWIEERAPELQYVVVTAVDPRYAGSHAAAADRALATVNVGALVRRTILRTGGVALLALVVAVLLTSWWPARRVAHGAPPADVPNRLIPLTARVTPPAYARMPAREMTEPSTIAALVGSRIALDGRHDGTGVHATIGGDSAATTSVDGRWRVTISMPATPAAVRLVDRQFNRLIVLAPVADAPPTVVLIAPAHDTTIREPATGTLALAADGADDIGLVEGYFEYLITSGEEESGGVHAREARTGHVAFDARTSGALRATIRLDTLGLKGGDLVSVRAVVLDGNTVSGPGKGTSETRTIRVATKQEYDSLAIDAAPPLGADSGYMSQLMIVLATKALIRREHATHPPLAHDTLAAIAARLGDQEHTLNERISTIRYEGGEATPLLDTASQALSDAEAALDIAQPDTALRPELVALRALDKARQVRRLYLRGAPPAIVVNVERVRMRGTEVPDAGPRTSATIPDTLRTRLAARLRSGVERLHAPRGSAAWNAGVDSLTLLRVMALPHGPGTDAMLPLAEALNDALTALRAGADATPALARARRAIDGPPTAASPTLSAWGAP